MPASQANNLKEKRTAHLKVMKHRESVFPDGAVDVIQSKHGLFHSFFMVDLLDDVTDTS